MGSYLKSHATLGISYSFFKREGVGIHINRTLMHKCLAPRTWSEVLPGLEDKEEPPGCPPVLGKGRMTSCNLTFLKKTREPGIERWPEATEARSHFGCRACASLENSNDILPALCVPIITGFHLNPQESGKGRRRGNEGEGESERSSPSALHTHLEGESHATGSHSCRITHAECKWQTISVHVYTTCSQPLHISTPRPAFENASAGGAHGLIMWPFLIKFQSLPVMVYFLLFVSGGSDGSLFVWFLAW